MKKFIAAAMSNLKARSFQLARALLTGSSSGLLDYETINLTYIFYTFHEVAGEGKGKIIFNTNIRNLISKQET